MKSTFFIILISFIFSFPPLAQEIPKELIMLKQNPDNYSLFAPKLADPILHRKIQIGLDISTPGIGYPSEDGESLYVPWNFTGSLQVWKINSPRSFPVQITDGENSTSILGETPQGKILLSRDIGGEENPGIYLMDKNGGEVIEIFKKEKVKTNFSYLAKDGSFFLFSANDQNPSTYTHYLYDLKLNKMIEFFNEPGTWLVEDVWKDEKTIIMKKDFGNFHSEHYIYNLGEKKLIPLIGQNEEESFAVRFGNSSEDFIVGTNKISNVIRLYHLKKGNLVPISQDTPFDIENFYLDQNRQRLLYEINQDGYTKVYGVALPNFESIELPNFSNNAAHITIGRTTNNSRYTSFYVRLQNEPSQNFVYDWNLRTLTSWTLPSMEEGETNKFTRPKLEYFPARDGTNIPYFVRIPPNCEQNSCPVIVYFHGGPESQTKPNFFPIYENFLEEGFIIVEPNVRGSSGYGKLWINSDNGSKRLEVITDIEDAGIYLKQKYNAKKVGVMGVSYGGYSTLYAMTRFAGTFDAGVSIVGMSNLYTFLMNTSPYRRHLRIPEYGDPIKDKDALLELSPITHIDKLKSPLLIIQGANDPRVPVTEALQFKEIAEKKEIPVDLIIFPDEGHSITKRSNIVIRWAKTLEFFIKHLK